MAERIESTNPRFFQFTRWEAKKFVEKINPQQMSQQTTFARSIITIKPSVRLKLSNQQDKQQITSTNY